MKASLNQKPCDVPGDLDTVADVLRFVEDERMPRGHMIFRIVLDGHELDEDTEELELDRPSTDVAELDLYSARPLDLARDGLRQAVGILPALAQTLMEAAGDLRSGHVQEGVQQLYEATGAIGWYVNLISTIEVLLSPPAVVLEEGDGLSSGGLSLPLEADELSGTAPELGAANGNGDLTAGFEDLLGPGAGELRTFASVENLRSKLLELERLQGSRDYRGLGDLLEHELLPIVRIWGREAPRLLKRVTDESGVA
jgi:hypothetical protein